MSEYNGEEIYVQDQTRMVTIMHTDTRVYVTGYCMADDDWSISWTIETTTQGMNDCGEEAI
jgi:hypothetical protein